MMIELFWPLSVFVVVCLVAEAVVSQLRYQWRITRLRKRGQQKVQAEKYGVSQAYISMIVNGKNRA